MQKHRSTSSGRESVVAFFFNALPVIVGLVLQANAFAEDWVSRYLQRPASDFTVADSLMAYSSSTRGVISLNGVWEARKSGEHGWNSISVPGAYEFEGEVEFRRIFSLDSSVAGKAIKLVALGVNNRCSVIINNSFVGSHSGGQTSFTIDIPPEKLRPDSPNEIRITVDNTLLPRASLPLRHSANAPCNYGGIFRDIFLIALPSTRIENVQIATALTSDYKDCTLTVKAQIQRAGRALSGSPFAWELAVSDSTGRLLGRARLDTLTIVPGSGSASVSLILEITNVELWSPEQPTLYQLRCSIIQNGKLIDEFISSLGFCEFVAVGRDFLLNGQPYRVKGLDWYENYENSGPVADITAIRHRVQLIKETGANAVRVVGLPPHPSFLSTCDELGLLVFQELPLNFVPDNFFLIQEFKGLVARYLDEMLKRDALHVSFAGLGLGCDLHLSHPAALDAVNNLIVIVRKQLQRPTYLAYRFLRKLGSLPAPAVNFIFVDGYNREPEDVIEFLNYLNSQEVNSPRLVSLGFPLLLADEGGTLSFYQSDGLQPTAAGLTPPIVKAQHRQASRLERALARIDSTRLATGIFIHTIADWREAQPNLIFARRPAPDLHLSGIISRDHGERVAHEVVRSFFGSGLRRMTAALPVPSYNPIIYPISGLGILLLFLFNLNRDSRLRSGLRRVFLFPHGFHMELRERRKVPFAHTAMLSFVVCMLLSIVVSSILFRLRYDLLFNSVLNLFIFSFSLKLAVIRLIWNPLIFIPVLLLSLYALYFFLILFLKTLDYIVGENLPLRQFFTVVFWDSANFVWLLPIVPIYHRIISQTNWAVYAIALVMLFALWTIVRLLRAIRVLYNMTLFGTTFMVMILGLLILGGVWWYVDQRYALFDYLPVYLQAL